MINTPLATYMALNKIDGLGIKRIADLGKSVDDITSLLYLSDSALIELGWKTEQVKQWRHLSWQTIEQELNWADKPDCYLLHWHDARYPRLLKEIHRPPVVLYVKGQIDALNRLSLAVVGTRHPTPYGKTNAHNFSCQLAEVGFCINSGLAMGIDGIAHHAVLNCPAGTVAVVATGLDQVYPARHQKLAHSILENGAIISEFPFKTSPRPDNFPRRNRIISGLSRGVLVIEAALKSGSLITARYAMEQGREVFAIPGIIQNPHTQGCHALIRQGAVLVNCVDDILEELGMSMGKSTVITTPVSLPNSGLLTYIDYATPISIDVLIVRSGLSPDHIMTELLTLELSEYIQKSGEGGYFRIK